MQSDTRDTIAYDPLPMPVLLAREDGGVWGWAYENPAAAPLPDRRALLQAMQDSFPGPVADGYGLWEGQVDGRYLSARLTCLEPGLVLALIRDETEDRQYQKEQLRSANAALQSALDAANAASRAKSDFLSNMSHDIRTPLNAIIGMTTIAQAHLGQTERVADCLDKISLSSRHLLNLINDILDMSRIESGKMTLNPEQFDMADLVHSIMAVFQPQADKKHQQVVQDFSGIRCEHVRGDHLRIQQVLINILSNAVKFTPEEGTITLRIRETGQPYSAAPGYAFYEFIVEDTGMGMSSEFLKRIFQPFERSASVSRIEGTGLGMAITSNLVEMMNGHIQVESQEGAGSCFTVTIPLEQLDSEQDCREELQGLRVLAADSDEISLNELKQMLRDMGMHCDACGGAAQAMELAAQARTDGLDYFAAILGWRMPGVDGVQTCRELRAMLGDAMPIFLSSSFEWTLSADEMRKYGVTAFIPKPYFRSHLRDALYAYTDSGRARRESSQASDRVLFDGRRVLLAEDNEINQEIAVELIGMLGAAVDCAENGQQAVEMFRQAPPGTYDLIFMDIQMPVMDGHAAARAIRALPRPDSGSIPIVAMTANAFVEDIRACQESGMNAHLSKPVSMQQLTDVMLAQLG